MDKFALYYQVPYVKEFEAEVTSCVSSGREKGKYLVELSKHGFYPEGGGQPADHGTIGDAVVLDVKDAKAQDGSETILHVVNQELPVGAVLPCKIDWERRMRYTRDHSGEHIVSGLVHKYFGYNNVGFHMSDVMTIDFDGILTVEELRKIEDEANAIVLENRAVKVLWPSEEEREHIDYRSKKPLSGDVRLVDLGGADLCACCGTHVMTTGEIGPIKLLSVLGHKGGVRIELFCGLDALKDYQRKHTELMELSRTLSVAPEEVPKALSEVLAESHQKDYRISQLNERYFAMKAAEIPENQELIVDVEEDLNSVELRKCCDYFMKHTSAKIVAVLGQKSGGEKGKDFSYVIGSLTFDVRAGAKAFNALVSGRGGGQKEMIQGNLSATPEAVYQALQGVF